MNPQVHHIKGQEIKINKTNNMITSPQQSLMKVYIIITAVKCSTLYIPMFITHLLCVIMLRVKEGKEIRRGDKLLH